MMLVLAQQQPASPLSIKHSFTNNSKAHENARDADFSVLRLLLIYNKL